jgi:hypothetical protein
VVELDEELHFNRTQTLQPACAAVLPCHDAHLDFSSQQEQQCLAAAKWGKRWTNPSCETMFGTPGVPGALEGAGAPRWTQRALYESGQETSRPLNSRTIRLARL